MEPRSTDTAGIVDYHAYLREHFVAKLLLLGYTCKLPTQQQPFDARYGRRYPDGTYVSVFIYETKAKIRIAYPTDIHREHHRSFKDALRLIIRNHRPRKVNESRPAS